MQQITTMQIQENMEMRYTRRARAVVVLHRGTAITLTFLTRTILSSYAEAFTMMVRLQACSVSATTMVIGTASLRSVRSWSHFDVTTKYTSKTHIKTPKTLKNSRTNDKSFKSTAKRLKTQNRGSTIWWLQKLYIIKLNCNILINKRTKKCNKSYINY